MLDVSFLLPIVIGAIIIVATILFGVFICCGKYCPACRQKINQRRSQDDLVRECTVFYYKTAAYPASQFNSCAVCLEDFLEKEKLLMCPCRHIFHKSCLVTWLETASGCPVCKATVRHTPDSNSEERAALLS